MPNKAKSPPFWGIRTPLTAGTSRLLSAGALLAALLVWCALSLDFGAGPIIGVLYLPSPVSVLKALVVMSADPKYDMWGALAISARRITIAFALCIAVAVPLGVLMGAFEAVNRVVDPLIAPLRFTPMNAFVSMFIVWFGMHETEKIAFLFFATIVFLLPVVVDTIRSVPEEMVQTALTLGATRRQVITTVLLPAALPQIFDSFRVMNGIAWGYILVAEMVNPQDGIGSLFDAAWRVSKTDFIVGLLLVVGGVGLLSDLAIRGINGVLFRWREQGG